MKKSLRLLLIMLLCFFSFSSAAAMTEEDVANHYKQSLAEGKIKFEDTYIYPWSVEPVEELARKGIVQGVGNGLFLPDNTVSRYEYLKMITGVCGIVNPDATLNYSDIAKDHWAYVYVAGAYEAGLLDIFPENAIDGETPITREEIAYVSVKAMLKSGCLEDISKNEPLFNDKDKMSDYSPASIATLNELGVINGRVSGDFSPKDFATRAESAKIIYNILNIVENNF